MATCYVVPRAEISSPLFLRAPVAAIVDMFTLSYPASVFEFVPIIYVPGSTNNEWEATTFQLANAIACRKRNDGVTNPFGNTRNLTNFATYKRGRRGFTITGYTRRLYEGRRSFRSIGDLIDGLIEGDMDPALRAVYLDQRANALYVLKTPMGSAYDWESSPLYAEGEDQSGMFLVNLSYRVPTDFLE
jgi:hypothetical protein